MRKVVSLATVMVLLIVCVVWVLRKAEKPGEMAHLRISYLPTSSCLPLFVALEKGYFKEANIEVEVLRFTSSNDALNSVLAGRSDGTPGFGLSSFFAIEAKHPGQLKLYLPCVEDDVNYANNLLIPVASMITNVQELAGKKVGTYTSSTQLLYLKLIMANALPKGMEWQIVQVDEKLQLQALMAGQFDALFTLEPNGTIAVNKGIAKVLVPNPRCRFIFSPFPAGANCFSSEFVKKDPDLAKKAAQIFVRAVQEIRHDPAVAKAILTKYTPLEANVASKAGLYTWWLPGEEDMAPLQRLANLLHANGLISTNVTVTTMWYAAK